MRNKFKSAVALTLAVLITTSGMPSTFAEDLEVTASTVQEDSFDVASSENERTANTNNILNSLTPEQLAGEQVIVSKDGSLSTLENGKLKPYTKNILKGLQQSNSDHESLGESTTANRIEIIEKRDEYAKHYLNDDGTMTAVISGVPVHYKKGDHYEPIDLELNSSTDSNYAYANETNTFKSYFVDQNSNKDGTVAKFVMTNSNGTERSVEYRLKQFKADEVQVNKGSVKYLNISKGVDLEYLIDSTKLKENIYLNEPVNQFDHEFYLKLDGVELQSDNEGGFYFIDTETQEQVWRIMAPLAEDSGIDKLTSKAMHYEVSEETHQGEILKHFKLVFDDKDFLKKAVYPVVIDPSMARISGRSISSDGFAQDDSVWGYAFPGFPNGVGTAEYIVYLNFNISSVPRTAVVTNSNLQIIPAGTLGSSSSGQFLASRLTSSSSSATWWNKPSITTSNQAAHMSSGMTTKNWNVTNMMKEIIANSYTFYGFQIQASPAHAHSFFYDSSHYPTLTVDYVLNDAPVLNVSTPLNNSIYSEVNTSVSPQITGSDANNNTLTCKVFVDSESTPRNTQSVSSTTTAKTVTFSALNMSTFISGSHTMRFEVNDGIVTTSQTVSIKVDKENPNITASSLNETQNTLTVNLTASDSVSGLDSSPYQFGIDGAMDLWVSGSSKQFINLLPNKQYEVTAKVRDKIGHITTWIVQKSTLAQTPTVNVTGSSGSSLNINISDINPEDTEYQIMAGTQYVTATGALSDTAQWITDVDKSLTVTNLTALTEYSLKVKARNRAGLETAFSSIVKGITSSNVPTAPGNLSITGTGNRSSLSWETTPTATQYEVEINGNIAYKGDQLTFIHSKLIPGSSYQYRVRAINSFGAGNWSAPVNYTVPKNVVAIETVMGKDYLLSFSVNNIKSFANKTFKIAYDVTALSLVDLCDFTWAKETLSGEIAGQYIQIISVENGEIKFALSQPIEQGYQFSGTVNTVRFNALKSTVTQATFSIQ